MATGLVIGGGPAGLMAAQAMAQAGLSVVLAEAKPTLGRKFLMAGKSGLNLTKDEAPEDFVAAYGAASDAIRPMLADFGPSELRAWAEGLGQTLFTGTTGRVFPTAMKSSPLLRAWAGQLTEAGVDIRVRWHWNGFQMAPDGGAGLALDSGEPGGRTGLCAVFDTPQGVQEIRADVVVLALGGASWARLGSDGAWARHFPGKVAPFQPANAGIAVSWSDKMAELYGTPVKSIQMTAGDLHTRGEAVLSARGLEGGGIYMLTPALRDGVALHMDLMPDLDVETLRARLARRRRGDSLSSHLRRALKLSHVKRALLMEFGRPLPDDLAPLLKSLPVRYVGILPMNEAISTAGGLRFDGLDQGLMCRDQPGVFVAGEMIDWEAPTGGYLLTACLATGQWAGRHAADYACSLATAR